MAFTTATATANVVTRFGISTCFEFGVHCKAFLMFSTIHTSEFKRLEDLPNEKKKRMLTGGR